MEAWLLQFILLAVGQFIIIFLCTGLFKVTRAVIRFIELFTGAVLVVLIVGPWTAPALSDMLSKANASSIVWTHCGCTSCFCS